MKMRCIVMALTLVLCWWSGAALADEFVADVQVRGNRLVETAAILKVISVQPGQEVTATDLNRDIRAIYGMGRFEDVSALIEEVGGVRTLIYEVKERPLVRLLSFSGSSAFKDDDLREASGLKVPAPFDPAKMEPALEALRQKFKGKGYYSARISYKLDAALPGAAEIRFEVEEGPKARIRNIRFEGNNQIPADELQKALITKVRGWLSFLTGTGTYREEVMPGDQAAIEELYQNRGFIQVKAHKPIVTLKDDGKSLELLFEIEEGKQFFVGTLDIRGSFHAERAEVANLIKLRHGEVFDRSAMRTSLVAINDLFADRGYAFVNVSPLTHVEPEKQLVNVTFDIEQGQQIYINRINVSGNKTTLDRVIRRELRLQEGDLYSAAGLKESRKRVRNTGYFEEVGIATRPADHNRYMDLDVEVIEQNTGMFTVGAGYDTAEGAVFTASVTERNFLGHGLQLIASGTVGQESSTYRLGLTDPYFLDYNLTAGFDIYKTEREWDDFTRLATGGSLKFGWELTDTWRTLLTYTYETKEITEIRDGAADFIRQQEGTSVLSSLTASLTRDTTDYRFDPREGSIARLSLEGAGLGGDEEFLKFTSDYTHFFPLAWDTVLATRGSFGYAWGYSGADVPIDERFYLGGINSLRGFSNRTIGPKDGISFIGGESQLYANIDYIFPLLPESGVKGVVFFDVGNTWLDMDEFLTDPRYSAGFEIRWRSPMGPLRIGYGFNLVPKDGESSGAVLFSFGTFY